MIGHSEPDPPPWCEQGHREPGKGGQREPEDRSERRVMAQVERDEPRGALPGQRPQPTRQVDRPARLDDDRRRRAVRPHHLLHAGHVQLVDVLRQPGVQAEVPVPDGEHQQRRVRLRVHRRRPGRRDDGGRQQEPDDADLVAGGHIRHLDHAARGVDRVLREEGDRTGEGDLTLGVAHHNVRGVSVALQVDVGATDGQRVVHPDDGRPGRAARLADGDLGCEVDRPCLGGELRGEPVEADGERDQRAGIEGAAPGEGVVVGDRVREPPALHDDRLAAVVQQLAGGDGHQQAHQGQVEHDVPALPQVAALRADRERGYLRESGNIVFHLALVGLLVAVATGQLLHYRGQAIVVEGRGFANAVTDYDTFAGGSAFDPGSLVPFTVGLDRFTAEFTAEARPVDFAAEVTVREPGSPARAAVIRVNHPLSVGGANVYLQGNGYAPDVVVRDAAGEVAFAGAVPFLPQDAVYTSRGVIKVPDVSTGDQIGIVGFLLPTAVVTPAGAASVYPQPDAPLLVLTVWHGDLGLDTGLPQNVYELDVTGMEQVVGADGTPTTIVVGVPSAPTTCSM